MPCKCKRYDAWKNLILPHNAMLLYYKSDLQSLKIIMSLMPHRYVCLPDVEIRINCTQPEDVTIYLIYPGGTRSISKTLSKRALCALRKTYKGRPGWVASYNAQGTVILRRKGRVILEPAGKFYRKTVSV